MAQQHVLQHGVRAHEDMFKIELPLKSIQLITAAQNLSM